jgi:hypothetical protein
MSSLLGLLLVGAACTVEKTTVVVDTPVVKPATTDVVPTAPPRLGPASDADVRSALDFARQYCDWMSEIQSCGPENPLFNFNPKVGRANSRYVEIDYTIGIREFVGFKGILQREGSTWAWAVSLIECQGCTSFPAQIHEEEYFPP